MEFEVVRVLLVRLGLWVEVYVIGLAVRFAVIEAMIFMRVEN